MTRPNVIFILADDMGYGDMGCNNPESKIPTPNLDRLATQGRRFTDAHAASSVCTPSRYSILTGRYCWRSALKRSVLWPWDGSLIEPDRLTVGEALRQHGYRTACMGKWHLGWDWTTKDGSPCHGGLQPGDNAADKRKALEANIDFTKPMRGGPVDRGFDYYFGEDVPNFPPYTWFENGHLLDQPTATKPPEMFGWHGAMAPDWKLEDVMPTITRRAVQYIDEADDIPFFLYFALTAPHTPIVPTAEFQGMSQAGDYGDFVCEVDWTVGQIMEALDRNGLTENTLLIFTSDNGPECFAYDAIQEYGHYGMDGLRGLKRDSWEGGHRVPFIARWPEVIEAGSSCDDLICLMDFMPTVAEIIGFDLPPDAAEDSVSMLSSLKGEGQRRQQLIHHTCSGRFAVRQGDWVFIDHPTGDDNREPEWFRAERGYTVHDFPGELFNVANDRIERYNLYGQHAERVARMKQLLEDTKAHMPPQEAIQGPSSE